MLNRWIEEALLDTLERPRRRVHRVLAARQGMLTDRYLSGIPADSRPRRASRWIPGRSTSALTHVRALNEIAQARGQSLAQLALTWALRDPRMTSLVIGASSVTQLENNLGALDGPPLTDSELAAIDQHAVDAGINLWKTSSAA